MTMTARAINRTLKLRNMAFFLFADPNISGLRWWNEVPEDCTIHPNKKPGCISQAKFTTKHFVIFGGLAILVTYVTVDPWLCVAGFHRVCLYRMLSCETILAQG